MTVVLEPTPLRQRADYTYKFNTKTGRHGWLRLTPAYSLKIVEELVAHRDETRRVFDPFCGTGTTALSAAYHGHTGVTTDINPFLVWLANAKTAHYSAAQLERAQQACQQVLRAVRLQTIEPVAAPPIFNIERWWAPEALRFLCQLLAAINALTRPGSNEQTLLKLAFCRTLIEQSNAAFNHQSMSFKSDDQLSLDLDVDWAGAFAQDVHFILAGGAENPRGTATVIQGDARWPSNAVTGSFDLVITSPPYANRMSYIRELRPYMYWLGYLENGRDAGEMDWVAIGGTWGIATSRLNEWERGLGHFGSRQLAAALHDIAHPDNKNGVLLAKYVAKYFDDMWLHFQDMTSVLTVGAELHYIVGNSTFYGTLVPTEAYYAEMLKSLGFRNVKCNPIRKRNSKKELVEFDVVATWHG